MRCLVTGGSGFIGSHLCESLLELGHEVLCMDSLRTPAASGPYMGHPRFKFMKADVRSRWDFPGDLDRVYHLACPASPVHYQMDPVGTLDTAFTGTMNALRRAAESGARLVITSTSEIYGDPLESPQRESYWGNVNPVGPRSCYDEGKRAGEALAFSWVHQYGGDVRVARLFNTYGPRMASGDGRIVPNFITQALSGQDVTVYGDGSQTRSFCYVSDTVDALIRLMEAPPAGFTVVNVGNPDERTVLSVAESVVSAARSGSRIVRRPLPQDDPRQRLPDISRAKELLGWAPRVGFDEGLRMTVEWFRGARQEGPDR